MGINLATEKGETTITKENFSDSLGALEQMLEPGMPVIIQNFSWNSLAYGGGRRNQNILFFSGGHVSKKGVFDLEKGKRNFSCVQVYKNDHESYRVINALSSELTNYTLAVPSNWTANQYNEGTFSRLGGVSWQSLHSAGTEKIFVGRNLLEQFPEAFRALQFARDAIRFELNPFYSHQNKLIHYEGEKINDEKEKQRTRETTRIACLRASANLLVRADHELTQEDSFFNVTEIGCSSKDLQRFREKGYPVEKQDCIVYEISHPYRAIAFVKTNNISFVGEVYVLPYNEQSEEIVKLAFSNDFVKKYYPFGR